MDNYDGLSYRKLSITIFIYQVIKILFLGSLMLVLPLMSSMFPMKYLNIFSRFLLTFPLDNCKHFYNSSLQDQHFFWNVAWVCQFSLQISDVLSYNHYFGNFVWIFLHSYPLQIFFTFTKCSS